MGIIKYFTNVKGTFIFVEYHMYEGQKEWIYNMWTRQTLHQNSLFYIAIIRARLFPGIPHNTREG